MELQVQLFVCFDRAAVRLDSKFQSIMKRAILASISLVTLLARGAIAQIPPTDRRMIPPRSIQLSAEQDYVIKENLKECISNKFPAQKRLGLATKCHPISDCTNFRPVVEKVPKVKTYKFFITENQIVIVSPQNEIADIIK
jgi:hypothetical protein